MGGKRLHIKDSEGNEFTTTDIANIIGKTRNYATELVSRSGAKTLKEFAKVLDGIETRKRAKVKPEAVLIPDGNGKIHSIREIAKFLGRSVSWVRKAHVDYGCNELKDFEFLKRNPPKYSTADAVKAPKFNRKICYREDFRYKCDNYSSCADMRCIGKHHKRYKKDGSCFICEEMEELTEVLNC